MFTSNKTVDQRKITDLEELATIEPPNRDDVSEIFKPVKHFDFVNTMIEGLKDRQGRPRKFIDDSTGDIIELEATGGSYIVSGSYFNKTEKKNYFGTDIHGALDIVAHRDGKLIEPCGGEMDMKLGFKSSNASKVPLVMFVSALVKVCSNGMIADKILDKMSRKHTIGMNLKDSVDNGLQVYAKRFGQIEETVDRFKQTAINQSQLNDILVSACTSRKLVSWSGAGKVNDEYESTDHRDKHGEGNLWSVYNAFTEVAKGFSPERQTKVFGGLSDCFWDARVAPKPEYSFS